MRTTGLRPRRDATARALVTVDAGERRSHVSHARNDTRQCRNDGGCTFTHRSYQTTTVQPAPEHLGECAQRIPHRQLAVSHGHVSFHARLQFVQLCQNDSATECDQACGTSRSDRYSPQRVWFSKFNSVLEQRAISQNRANGAKPGRWRTRSRPNLNSLQNSTHGPSHPKTSTRFARLNTGISLETARILISCPVDWRLGVPTSVPRESNGPLGRESQASPRRTTARLSGRLRKGVHCC